MKILLVDADSHNGFPNLALMKLSAWHKERGDEIDLIKGIPEAAPLEAYDEVFISCIFFQNAEKARDYALQCEQVSEHVELGGSGIDHNVRLPDAIEHIMPDYDLYGLDFSLGFTSRGCIRKCPWCIVPKKEGKMRDNAPVSEFHDCKHSKVVLLDNNFQASPRWRENIEYIQDLRLKVNFNQGLDARLINDEFGDALSRTYYYSWSFKTKGFHLACDTPQAIKPLEQALEILDRHGIPAYHAMVYVLVGFNTTYEQDLERVKKIIALGAKPYIMRYNKRRDSKALNDLARWVNRKYYQFLPLEEYKK